MVINAEHLTGEERERLDTLAVNYVIAQSDGYQLGYAQAIRDFTEYIMDYWRGSDDGPQQSVLDSLVDLGVELGRRKHVAERNVEKAKDIGYEDFQYAHRLPNSPFERAMILFKKTNREEDDKKGDVINGS